MKTTIIIAIFALAIGTSGYAQTSTDQYVKILPTSTPGVIKLHYALAAESPVHVTFFDARQRVVGRDRISVTAPQGLSKRYDVNKLKSDFWMEVTSGKNRVVYHISSAKYPKHFSSRVESSSNQFLVKANN